MKLVPALCGFLIILLACGAETPNVTPVGTIAPTPTPTPRVIVVTTAPTATPMPSSTPVPTTMPTPTQRVVAADTPVPTITSEPTVTPEPTATAAPAATPIPTPTVTPVPPTATPTPPRLGSRQNPVQLGTEVDVKNAGDDHWRIAVIDTVPDATRLVLGENPFNNPPKEGFRFYIVTIRVQYLGPDSTSFGGGYRLKALGIGGVVYTTFADSCGVIPDDLPDPELFTNGTVEGNVCWEVADDDVDSLQMFLDSGLFSGLLSDTPRTWFALQDKTSN